MKINLIHCSYHKCLTSYYCKVMRILYNRIFRFGINRRYNHFSSLLDDFYKGSNKYFISSINNHVLDFSKLGEYRISRFIRDPRDMVVSGYFYHKSGAEKWCKIVNPTEEQWKRVNGCIPSNIGKDHSFFSYLNNVSQEEGLIAEIEFRKNHFNSMLRWPVDDPRIKIFRYEEIIGNEGNVFDQIFSFYGISWLEKKLGLFLAKKYAVKKQTRFTKHIRDPKSEQWKEYFTSNVKSFFEERYSDILEFYGYK